MKAENKKATTFIILQMAVFLYSIVSVLSKVSSGILTKHGVLSIQFIGCFVGMFVVLGVYAVIWQFVLKKIDLSIAYANKGITLFWSLIWSISLFKEYVSVQNVIGIIIIMIGVVVISNDA